MYKITYTIERRVLFKFFYTFENAESFIREVGERFVSIEKVG